MGRIGLVVHGQPPELVGGTELLVAELARGLAGRGDAVEVFSGSIEWRPEFEVVRDTSGPVPVVRVHRHDLFFERWDKVHNPLVERAFGEWLDAWQPELLHVHHWARLTTTLVDTAARRGIPAVVSLHDLFPSCPRYHRVKEDMTFCTDAPGPEACRHCAPRWRFQPDEELDASAARFVAEMTGEVERAAALLAPTAGHGRRVLDWLGLDRDLHVLPPGSETSLAPATRPLADRVATPADPLRVGSFGHLHPLKGVEVLLDAQAALPDPSLLELHVWGEAPEPEMAAALQARAGERSVHWHGAYRPEQLGGAPIDAVVLPTLCAESYSFALDEAGALGVPVLATDLGSLADRATERVRLFPRGDAGTLAAALAELAADAVARDRMAAAPAPERWTMERHLEALGAIYDEVRRGPRPAPVPPDPEGLARRIHAFRLREVALKELLRSEGWEDVVARLQAEVAALRPNPPPEKP